MPSFSFARSALEHLRTAKHAVAVSVVHRAIASRKLWTRNLDDELTWWDEYLRTRGEATGHGEGFRKRMSDSEPLQSHLAAFLKTDNPKLIDVGSGPVTTLGKTLNGKKLDITAVDSLADRYNELLDKYGLRPPVRTRAAESEKLTELFEPNTFDLAHAETRSIIPIRRSPPLSK